MRAGTEYILRVRPWSPQAFLVATATLLLAASIQEALVVFGMPLYFAAFFPAILLASFVAGAPAGIFAMAATVPLVWWAFMPPHFEFNPLTAADYDSFAMFLLVSALVICFSHLYREARVLMRK